MNDEPFYRLALLAVFAGVTPIGVYHRRQAARSGERFSRRDEGLLLAVTLRLAGLILWLAAVAYLIWPRTIAWASVPLPESVRYSGIAFGLLGVGMMYWTLTNLGKNLTDTVATRREATLITRGPYAWVRHPFYITAAILIVAATLLSANLLIGITGAIVLLLLALRTPKEEEKLLEKFGESYREYCRTTGRFVPRAGRRLSH